MSRIAVLYGGRSGEHEVSCQSAATVYCNLLHSHRPILIGITQEGIWYLQEEPDSTDGPLKISTNSSARIWVCPGVGFVTIHGEPLEVDVVLPVLHGSYGEDGTIQGLLESARLPYAGCGVLGSALGMDKDVTKRMCRDAGLPVVPWRTLRKDSDTQSNASSWRILCNQLGSPLFVKPANTGSSVGVSCVDNAEQFQRAVELAFLHDKKILIEKAVKGREIECSVMGYGQPEAFPPGEVVPVGAHEFYDYEAKYMDPEGAILHVPAELPDSTVTQIRDLAVRAYVAVEAGGLARVDFLVDHCSGDIFINEINTLPGMTSISLFPRMVAAGGLNFAAMLERLIAGAIKQHAIREGLHYTR